MMFLSGFIIVAVVSSGMVLPAVSQFFIPDLKHGTNDFAAAWIVHKHRLVQTKAILEQVTNMAGASFAVVRNPCQGCMTYMTYDYLNFMVEHLSSMTNQLAVYSKGLLHEKLNLLQFQVYDIRKSAKHSPNPRSRVMKSTLAVLVYSSIPFSSKQHVSLQRKLRKYYIQLTFWSVYYYFRNVIIYVGSVDDYHEIESLQLPLESLILLPDVPKNVTNETVALPKMAILSVIEGIDSNRPLFDSFSYVYFSEGDQILHLRMPSKLFQQINQNNGSVAIAPHRFQVSLLLHLKFSNQISDFLYQTLPLVNDFPPRLQSKFHVHSSYRLPSAQLINVKDSFKYRGSCCDGGRYEIAMPCMRQEGYKSVLWWYQCTDYGLKNISTWMKFGRFGFTFPLTTVHRRFCHYSSQQSDCPIYRTEGQFLSWPTTIYLNSSF
jgi:hypothetical protein